MAAAGETAPGEAVAEVVLAVRDGIMQGTYAPGQRLPEADLVSLYRASRGTVRTALAQLENEGLVQRERNRGARVRPISRKPSRSPRPVPSWKGCAPPRPPNAPRLTTAPGSGSWAT
jgi:DNA-binding GntR family transcriptional regulator